MLAVIHKLVAGHLGLVHSVAERSHRAVAVALNLHRRIVLVFQLAGEMHMSQIVLLVLLLADLVIHQAVGAAHIAILLLEQVKDLLRFQFLTLLVAGFLYHGAKLRVHGLGHLDAIVVGQNKGSAALAGLRIDPNDRLILSTHICRVDRQVRNLPIRGAAFFHIDLALVDGILMRAGECGKHQLAGIRLAGRHLHLGAALVNFCDLTDIFNI